MQILLFIKLKWIKHEKVTKAFGVLALTIFLGLSTPVILQTTGDNTSTTATTEVNGDDTGK